jgi:hypothetical protein
MSPEIGLRVLRLLHGLSGTWVILQAIVNIAVYSHTKGCYRFYFLAAQLMHDNTSYS